MRTKHMYQKEYRMMYNVQIWERIGKLMSSASFSLTCFCRATERVGSTCLLWMIMFCILFLDWCPGKGSELQSHHWIDALRLWEIIEEGIHPWSWVRLGWRKQGRLRMGGLGEQLSGSSSGWEEEGALGEELSAWQAVGRRTARRSAGNIIDYHPIATCLR